MKSFKSFFKNIQKEPVNILDFGGGFSEMRRKRIERQMSQTKEPVNILDFGGGFSEMRKKKHHKQHPSSSIKETGFFYISVPIVESTKRFPTFDSRSFEEEPRPPYRIHSIHSHPDIAPHPDMPHEAPRAFTSAYGEACSDNINTTLRNPEESLLVNPERHKKILQHAARLSSLYTKRNTNRIPVLGQSGVPAYIGKQILAKGVGHLHMNKGFQSISVRDQDRHDISHVAHDFAAPDLTPGHLGDRYIQMFHVGTGNLLSAAHVSHHKEENEMILHHSTPARFMGHQTVVHPDGHQVHILHMFIPNKPD